MSYHLLTENSPITAGDKVVVVGAGSSGTAAVKLLVALGASVLLVDAKAESISDELASYAKHNGVCIETGEHSAQQFAGAKLVVTSPGVPLPPLHTLLATVGNPPLIGEIELGLYFVQEPIIGITGTSGKTTTASLTAHMLQCAGKKVFLGGNIGVPLCKYIADGAGADVLVLELSSFQLQSCKQMHPHVAVMLNLSENHLDQHSSMQEYADAKFSLFAAQTSNDVAVIGADLVKEYQRRGYKGAMRIITPGEEFEGMQLFGPHNKLNASAAFLAASVFGVTKEQAKAAVASFIPLEHRLERVHEAAGVIFVNDSKSTTVDALRVALHSFEGSIYLLAGGKFKGGDLASLRPLLTQKVAFIALYGASKDIFMQAWQGAAPMNWFADMEKAMEHIQTMVAAGDIVLLSPATASYDQYKNYLERGKHFTRLAKGLQCL